MNKEIDRKGKENAIQLFGGPLQLFDSHPAGGIFRGWPSGFFDFPLFGGFEEMFETVLPEITETDEEFSVSLELPGFEKDKIDVSIARQAVTVKAEKKKRGECVNFARQYSLPDYVDISTMAAEYKDGILRVWAKKLPTEKPVKIEVK